MDEPFSHDHLSYLHIEKWQKMNPKLKAGFTIRIGGKSESPFDSFNMGLHVSDCMEDVITNRKQLAEALHVSMDKWVSGEQVHQTRIKSVRDQDKGKGAASYQSSIKETDGLITNQAGILCTAFFADCVPLYFFDPVSGYIGLAHAGWKGTVHLIAEKMVARFAQAGVKRIDLQVVIGPCISKPFYEVDQHIIDFIDEKYREKTVTEKGNHRYLLDLKQLNVEILLQSGILRHNIDVTNYCTFNQQSLFFSHRRDSGKTGRMLGFLGYTP